MIKSRKVAFIFKRGRKSRLNQGAIFDNFPSDFFYGYIELKAQGFPVDILDEDDLNINMTANYILRVINHFTYYLFGLNFQYIALLSQRKNLHKLNQFSELVVTTNALGLTFAFMKKIGLLKPKIIIIGMGLGDLMKNKVRKWFLEKLLRSITTLLISKSELDFFKNSLHSTIDLHYLPFGVDSDFWTPISDIESENNSYILSIGNDSNRDYHTLISAWKDSYPQLKIVTKLPISAENRNIEIIAGDWREQLISDKKILELIQNSMFVIIPINPTLQPSGQSVCLQSMSCSKAVIISNIKGIWDKELLIKDKNIKLSPCNDVTALSRDIEYFLAHPDYVKALGKEANKTVKENFRIELMANSLKKYIFL